MKMIFLPLLCLFLFRRVCVCVLACSSDATPTANDREINWYDEVMDKESEQKSEKKQQQSKTKPEASEWMNGRNFMELSALNV